MGGFYFCGLVLAIAVLCSNHANSADYSEIQRLRKQRLYRVAESKCVEALNRVGLTSSEAALWTVELLRTYSAAALDSQSEQRTEIWPKSLNYSKQFDRRFSKSPYAAIVHLQYGILLNLRATIERIENKVRGDLDFPSAKRYSREAIRSLGETLKEIARIRPSPRGNGLTASQKTQLRHKTQRELGLAIENYSQCFSKSSPDEVSQLILSVKYFESLARLKSFPNIASESRLYLARCHRRLGNYGEANKELSRLESSDDAPAHKRISVATERAHLFLDQGDLINGLRSSETVFPTDGVKPSIVAEYELAKLRALTMICERNNEPRHSPRNQRAEQIADDIGKNFSLYWKIQAEDYLALVRPHAVSASITLARRAQGALRAGRIDEALGLYVEAAQSAEKNGSAEKSLQLSYTAGAIAHQSQRYRQARELLRDAALRFKTEKQAADAHLLAIVDSAQLARSQNEQDVNTYTQLLAEHLRLWPNSATSNQVREWYGRLLFRQRKWREALDTFIQIKASSDGFASNDAAIKACCYHILDAATPESRQDTQLWLDEQLARISGQVYDAATPDVEQRLMRIELIRIALRLETSVGTPATETRLNEISSTFSTNGMRSEAIRCLALYYCNNKRFHDAEGLLKDPASFESQGLFRLLIHVFQSTESYSSQLKKYAADVLVPLANELASRELRQSELRRTQIVLASSLRFAGRRAEALSLARALNKEDPKSGEIHELLATLLQDSTDAREITSAIYEWRAVAKGSKPGSDRWFRSKLALAECYFQIEQHKKAADVIRLTQTLHPRLGGDKMKLRFQNLLRKVEQAEER